MIRNYLRSRYGSPLNERIMKCLGEQFMYGQRETLLEYMEISKTLMFVAKIPHSGNSEFTVSGKLNSEWDWNGKPLLQAVWDKQTVEYSIQNNIKNVVSIGAPFLYSLINHGSSIEEIKGKLENICSKWNWSADESKQLQLLKNKKVLILPLHGWQGDIIHNSKAQEFSNLLRISEIAEQVSFCLTYLDFLNPTSRHFYGESKGFQLHCAGIPSTEILHSPVPARTNFFKNLINIFSEYDFIIGEEFTTGLWYAACMGKSIGILHKNYTDAIISLDSHWNDIHGFLQTMAVYRNQYSYLIDENISKEYRYMKISNDLGLESLRTKFELSEMLPVMEVPFDFVNSK